MVLFWYCLYVLILISLTLSGSCSNYKTTFIIMGDPIIVQKQIKDNTEDLHNFVRDLKLWEEEMKRKDRQLSTDPQEEILPPVRKAKVTKKVDSTNQKKEEIAENKNKRIASYDYKSWDKFDVEKACEDVDNKNESDSEEEEIEDAVEQEKYLKEKALYEKELGNRHVKAGKWDEAIIAYTNAIAAFSRDPIFFANRALCYLKKSKYEAVESDCTEALKLDATYVKALMRRAAAREALGRLQDARHDLRFTLQLEPNNVQARKDLERVQAATSKKDCKTILEKKDKSDAIHNQIKIIPTNKCSEKEIDSGSKANKSKSNFEAEIEEPKWKPCTNTVLPVNKPPHLRSQKSLKRIEIYDIGPNLPAHECKRKLKLQVVPPVDEDDRNSNPAAKGTNARSILTMSSLPNTLKELPPSAKNSVQFHKSWSRIKEDRSLCHRFLKQIPGETLPDIFKESLESQMFSDIIQLLATEFVSAAEPVFPYLHGISAVRRFSTIVMFMSSKDKQHLSTLFSYCQNRTECSAEDINQLRRVYEM